MFVPVWIIALALTAIVVLLALLVTRRGGRDMLDQQRREATRSFTRPAPAISSADAAQILADPEVQAALAAGRKIEAIKLVREKTGLGLKEAKELVEASV